MADLTIGEIGKILQTTLKRPNGTVLDVSGSVVTIQYIIGIINKDPVVERAMQIVDGPGGVVRYMFQAGDLAKPSSFGEFGLFNFTIKVVTPLGLVFYSSNVQTLSIKDRIES